LFFHFFFFVPFLYSLSFFTGSFFPFLFPLTMPPVLYPRLITRSFTNLPRPCPGLPK
jgi:hypothetical protein